MSKLKMTNRRNLHLHEAWCILFVIVNLCSTNDAYLVDNNPYRHFATLDPAGKYQLEWLVNWEQRRVIFNLTVATTGYVGFGLARKGKMAGADIVIGGVRHNGKPYFSDRHAVGNQLPEVDPSQDWDLHTAWKEGNRTFLSFSRPFDTCDGDHDLPIDNNGLSILWAYSEVDDELQYHFQHRGVYDVYLLDPDLTPRILDPAYSSKHAEAKSDMNIFRITREMRVPAQDTAYWCSFHKVPTKRKHHIIGFQTVLPTETDKSHIHHLLLHRCRAPPGVDPVSFFEGPARSGGTECYVMDRPSPLPLTYCRDTIHVWAVGGRAIFFPSHAGMPMSVTDDEYLMLQVHFTTTRTCSRTSLLQLHLKLTIQRISENDVGILQLGTLQPGSQNIIPPSSPSHVINGHCSPGCTQRMFPPSGVNIFAVFLHTHITGRGIRARHFRGNQELPWIQSDDNYNFNYQPFRILRQERKLLPGDHFINRCLFDSTNSNGSVIHGGFSTREEMCSAFMYYYGWQPGFALCRSEIRAKAYWDLLGIHNVTWVQSIRQTVVTSPSEYRGLTMRDYANTYIDWNRETRRKLQDQHMYQRQVSSCPRVYFADSTEQVAIQLQTLSETGFPGSDGRPYTSVDSDFEFEAVYPRGVSSYKPPPQCNSRSQRRLPALKNVDAFDFAK